MMAHERATRAMAPQQIVPEEFSWQRLLDAGGQELEHVYSDILNGLAGQPGDKVSPDITWCAISPSRTSTTSPRLRSSLARSSMT
jgi:hypothetical protein